ncbi:MAG: HEAT repeat domain-containing protein [Pirellulales bacterium]|nr:HEAT repeat domain-containing protein [Pirellulales bacterium]
MNTRRALMTLVPVLLFLLLAAGCVDREPVASMKKLNNAENQLASHLAKVRDADSARAAISNIKQSTQEMLDASAHLIKLMPKHRNTKVSEGTFNKLKSDREAAVEKLFAEIDRVFEIRGLPVEFWRVMRPAFAKILRDELHLAQQSDPTLVPYDLLHNRTEGASFLEKHGHDHVIVITFEGLPASCREKALAKIRAVVPNVTFLQEVEEETMGLMLGPVDDYKAVLGALDFGHVTFEDEPQRRIEMNVDSFKLRGSGGGTNRGGNMQMPGWPGHQQEETGPSPFELQQQKREKERQAREAEQRRQRDLEKQLARQRELQGPDRSDPQYFEKMAERMVSDDKEIRNHAIGALLLVNPTVVASPETSKRIARQYKALLSERDMQLQAQGIRGVALWGGTFSVPFLVELLMSNNCDLVNRRLILVKLGEFRDPRAAKAVTALLQDATYRRDAYECLEKLGPLAEDALIKMAASGDPTACMAAVELLGKVGTSKSLPVLRAVATRGYPAVRETAKLAIRLVMQRKNAPLAKPTVTR